MRCIRSRRDSPSRNAKVGILGPPGGGFARIADLNVRPIEPLKDAGVDFHQPVVFAHRQPKLVGHARGTLAGAPERAGINRLDRLLGKRRGDGLALAAAQRLKARYRSGLECGRRH